MSAAQSMRRGCPASMVEVIARRLTQDDASPLDWDALAPAEQEDELRQARWMIDTIEACGLRLVPGSTAPRLNRRLPGDNDLVVVHGPSASLVRAVLAVIATARSRTELMLIADALEEARTEARHGGGGTDCLLSLGNVARARAKTLPKEPA